MKIHPQILSTSIDDYVNAIEQYKSSLEELDSDRIYGCLLYGSWASYLQGNKKMPMCGRSDIDSMISLDCNVVTDPDLLLDIGGIIKMIIEEKRVPIGASITDISTTSDGRFFSFYKTSGFDRIMDDGKIIYGNDFRDKLKVYRWKDGSEAEISHKLREMRKRLVESLYYSEHNKILFYDGFQDSLKHVRSLPVDVKDYLDDMPDGCDNGVFKKIIDAGFVEEADHMLNDGWKDVLKSSHEDLIEIEKRCLNFYENAVRELIKLPRPIPC